MLPRLHWLWLLALAACGCRAPEFQAAGTRQETTARGTLQVTFIDVGQGDAALVRSPSGASLLIDGGPPDAGPRVIVELRRSGVERLDRVLGSHPHSDHIGGLVDVLREVPVQQVLDPGYNHGTALQRTYLQLIKDKGAKLVRARSGQTYDLGEGARLEILAPEEPLIKGTESDANNNSIVARLVFGRTRFLFTGDMEERERERLLQSHPPPDLQSDVLKVAHHGSHNGTDSEFLRAVQPRYAVISLAKGNDYGHPHQEAMDALEALRIPILRTDQRGTIRFTSDGTVGRTGGAPPPAPRAAAPAVKAAFIGNSESRVYHSPTCGSLPDADKRTTLASAAAAKKAGYRPHRACVK
jgi:competence protein ComEC